MGWFQIVLVCLFALNLLVKVYYIGKEEPNGTDKAKAINALIYAFLIAGVFCCL